jgi:hypothetical protein
VKQLGLAIVVAVVAFLSYQYGYRVGLSEEPSFQLATDRQAIETLEASNAYLRQEAGSPSPEKCLSIVADGNVDFGLFCGDYLAKDEADRYRGMPDFPD